MKSHETELKLQAWLDGELPDGEAAAFEQSMGGAAEFLALAGELRRTKTALAGGELPRSLPESREFFWSKVQRQIQREAQSAVPVPVKKFSWLGWVPGRGWRLGGAAFAGCAILLLMFSPARGIKQPGQPAPAGHVGRIEVACDSVGAYTYRDQQDQMTMVWLVDKTADDSQFTEASHPDKVNP